MKNIIEIIPAIDLIDGKCVRLTQGDYEQKKVYNEDPVEVARQFEDAGIQRLHLVDLDGAKKGEMVNLKVLEQIANRTKLCIDFGGGIKDNISIRSVFDAGAAFATIGSIAVKQPGLFFSWLGDYGPDKIILGADVKNENISVNGWFEQTDLNVISFLETYFFKGIKTAFCTDIAKDGLLQGPALDLYKKIRTVLPELDLIASGGVSSINDIYELNDLGCKGVIVGKAIYENRITLKEIIELNLNKSV